jgi:hypothetical protein
MASQAAAALALPCSYGDTLLVMNSSWRLMPESLMTCPISASFCAGGGGGETAAAAARRGWLAGCAELAAPRRG